MSLHDRSILIDLTLKGLGTARTDQRITRDVLQQTRAETDGGRWISRLWPKEALEPVRKHDAATRAYHQEQTLPWIDSGKRILPTARFPDYMATIRERKAERQVFVDDFLNRYDHWKYEAMKLRGDAYREADYPNLEKATDRFNFRVESEPVPHREDFRITLSGPDIEAMQATLDARIAEAERIARNDLIARLTTPLAHMVERLSEPGARFSNSLFGNVLSIAELIPDLNVTADPNLDAIRQEIMAKISAFDPDAVRDSDFQRNRAAKAASDILATMAPWLEEADAA